MGALRQSRSFDNEMNGSNGQSPATGYPSGVYVPSMNQGLPTLIVMVVVLAIIVLFCFWGAPAVRAFCKRKICRCCPMDDVPPDSVRDEELQDYILVSKQNRRSSSRKSHHEGAQQRDQLRQL